MVDPAQLAQILKVNLEHYKAGMKPLYDKWNSEADQISNDKEKKYHKSIHKKIKESHELHHKLTLELINGLYQISDDNKKELKMENENLIKEQEKLKRENVKIKLEQDKQEQRHKYETIKIHNITTSNSSTREDVIQSVIDYFKDADIPVDKEQIKSAVRPMKGSSKSPHIYCTFFRGSDKINVLRKRKTNMKENNDFQTKRPTSFITEDLTPLRQLIAFKLRKDTNRIAKSWSMDGKIKCLKVGHTTTDIPITIENPYDLTKAGWSNDEVNEFIQQHLANYED